MKHIFIIMALLTVNILSKDISPAKIVKLSQKGEKVAELLCDKNKLPIATGTIDDLIKNIEVSKACRKLSKSKIKALAYYISNGSMKAGAKHIHVPNGAKCPVCGMFVFKYPRWAAYMEENGKKHYFDGVKDMMKFYIFDIDFPYNRSGISEMEVTDFYTLDAIPAKDAYYVIGSEMFGPMGNELIPFASRPAAENFVKDHNGKQIVLFENITPKMVMALDGIEFDG